MSDEFVEQCEEMERLTRELAAAKRDVIEMRRLCDAMHADLLRANQVIRQMRDVIAVVQDLNLIDPNPEDSP